MPAVRILIVEDEVLIAEYLKDILISFDIEQIKLAHTRQQAMEEIEQFGPEVILLDIKMENDLAGIFIAEEIFQRRQIPVIFITAYADQETMQAALQTKPAAYITKPFKKIDVYAAISIVIKDLEDRAGEYFVFKDGYATVRLLSQEILYVESEGNYINIITTDKKYSIRQSLDWCMENLQQEQFIRIHRSFIVNCKKIDKITSRIVYINGKEIPVSRSRRKDIQNM